MEKRTPVPRRLRFEVLRRDNYTCRYCGASAPDVPLTVDHVIPVVLGGGDEPSNLVTACQDCNAGKSSTSPDEATVEDVAADALRWSRAMEAAAAARADVTDRVDADVAAFFEHWERHGYNCEVVEYDPPEPDPVTDPLHLAWRRMGWSMNFHARPVTLVAGVLSIQIEPGYRSDVRPVLKTKTFLREISEAVGSPINAVAVVDGWGDRVPPAPAPKKRRRSEWRPYPVDADGKSTVRRLLRSGVPLPELIRCAESSLTRTNVREGNKWRYFCGCAWRVLTDIQEDARRIVEGEGGDSCG